MERGRLKIFFGATGGVGMTSAMLAAAAAERAEGREVLVACAPAAPPLHGLEWLAGSSRDLDLDRALARRPSLLVVDELAAAQPTGRRHAHRWQDVEELLDRGLDVFTPRAVENVESLADVVARIRGRAPAVAVPDRILAGAEIEVVDLPPDELHERLTQGGSAPPLGDLIALRELALRHAAAHVDARVRDYRREHEIAATWPVAERVLVCVRPHAGSARLLRATHRMAASLDAEWIAAYVETSAQPPLGARDRRELDAALRLAEQLGGQTVVLSGPTVAEAVLAYAWQHNVSKIVTGKPAHARWRDRLRGSLLDDLVRASGDIDVYVISGASEDGDAEPPAPAAAPAARDYAFAIAAIAACMLATWVLPDRLEALAFPMLHLAAVAAVATRHGRRPAALAALVGATAWALHFLPLPAQDPGGAFSIAALLAASWLIGTLSARVRLQAEAALAREIRTAGLHATSRELAALTVPDEIAAAAARRVAELVGGEASVLLLDESTLRPVDAAGRAWLASDADRVAAEWVSVHGRAAGAGTDTLPAARARYVPLAGADATVGVLGVRTDVALGAEEAGLVDTLARLVAAPLERARLERETARARLETERERLRSTLLSSVSHDLRTPLAAITGAASTLSTAELPDPARRELEATILDESERLNRLVANLLEMTRLESGQLDLHREWHSVEELVGTALARLRRPLAGHRIETHLDPRAALVQGDGVLLEQLLVNLLENAAKYTPPGCTVAVHAQPAPSGVAIRVDDDGPGLPPGSEERVFEKFQREGPRGRTGFGLGLAICRAITTAHEGTITARNRPEGGVSFAVTLPGGAPPVVEIDG